MSICRGRLLPRKTCTCRTGTEPETGSEAEGGEKIDEDWGEKRRQSKGGRERVRLVHAKLDDTDVMSKIQGSTYIQGVRGGSGMKGWGGGGREGLGWVGGMKVGGHSCCWEM